MPDFQRVSAPVFTPTRCGTCSSHRDLNGFVDLLVDTRIDGRLYMCASCLYQAGRVMGMLNPQQSAKLTDRLASATEEILALQAELEAERQNKVVSLADVRELLAS